MAYWESTKKKVKSVSCAPAKDMQACCLEIAGGFAFAFSFCMAVCQLCCWGCTIEFETEIEEGPILADEREYPEMTIQNSLSFSTSQYGIFIPIVFGSDKLTGNVFWASPIEHVIKEKTLDDGSIQQIYYRTLNFAFGLCEGTINGVLRMWLGDKLIFDVTALVDEDGIAQPSPDGFILGSMVDLTDEDDPLRAFEEVDRKTRITVYTGAEQQLPEPTIVAAEGYINTPAYRGIAFVMFENFIIGSGSSVPNIFVEVTSNTESLFPRLITEVPVPQTHFDTLASSSLILYDLGYDRILAYSFDQSGDGIVPDGAGLTIFDGNSLLEVEQQELKETHDIDFNNNAMYLCARTGNIVLLDSDGNTGIVHVYNPLSKTIPSTLGPGGGISGHSLTTGFGAMGLGSAMMYAPGKDGVPTDIFCGVGLVNRSVGFAPILENGKLEFLSTLNTSLPSGTTHKSVGCNIDASFAVEEFVDGVVTPGSHLFVVSPISDGFRVTRFTTDGHGATIITPTTAAIGDISFELLGGLGFSHTVARVFMDPVDKCLVMLVTITSASREDRIVKWSPYTGEIVWNTPVGKFTTTAMNRGGDICHLLGQKYAWVDANDYLRQADLDTGEVTAEDLTLQALPSITNTQFYNGFEDSIVYISGNALVKVFLNRRARQTVDLADIVSLLCQRVGLLSTDIERTDLQALTLHGYTINQQKSLRDCFSELGQAFKYDVVESNGRIKYKTRGDATVETINHKHLADTSEEGWLSIRKQNDLSRIRKLNLTYRDIEREYANNVQSIILPRATNAQNWDNDAAIDVTVPIVLDAATAKGLAEILLYSKLVYDTTYDGELSGGYMNLDPADVIDITMNDEATETIRMRLRTVEVGADRKIKFEASQEDRDIYIDQVNLFGNVGRFEKSSFGGLDVRLDPIVLQIPYKDEAEVAAGTNRYFVYMAFLNTKPTALPPETATVYIDGGNRSIVKPPAHFPTWGVLTQAPIFRTSKFTTDRISRLQVKILSTTGMEIASVTKAELLEDDRVNLCFVAGELMQYEEAEEIEDGLWEFRNLHRGKFGTEMFVGAAIAGDRFILIGNADGETDDAIVQLQIPFGDSPRKVVQIFLPSNNPFQPAPVSYYVALNFRQLALADIKRWWDGDDAEFTWQRRTRFGDTELQDGDDAVPLNEAEERYVLYLHTAAVPFNASDETTYLRRVEVTTNAYTYLVADQVIDGYDNTVDDLYILAYQTGSFTEIDSGAATRKRLEKKV